MRTSRAAQYARALTIKAVLPLSVAGVTLMSGAAVAVPSITAAVNAAPVAAAAPHSMVGDGPQSPGMYHG